jgi:hypothetical protein
MKISNINEYKQKKWSRKLSSTHFDTLCKTLSIAGLQDNPNRLHCMGSQCQAIVALISWQILLALFHHLYDFNRQGTKSSVKDEMKYQIRIFQTYGFFGMPTHYDTDEEDPRYLEWERLKSNINFFLTILKACDHGVKEVSRRNSIYAEISGYPYTSCTEEYGQPYLVTDAYDFDKACETTYRLHEFMHDHNSVPVRDDVALTRVVKNFVWMASLPDNTWKDPLNFTLELVLEDIHKISCTSFKEGDVSSNGGKNHPHEGGVQEI